MEKEKYKKGVTAIQCLQRVIHSIGASKRNYSENSTEEATRSREREADIDRDRMSRAVATDDDRNDDHDDDDDDDDE